MRFLNTSTLRFEEVADSSLGEEQNKYAILSHRWGAAQDEISFADINEAQDISHKKGLAKVKGFCDMAASLGYRYGWADTCCINKGDSSELSEAINSMYLWYHASSVCIVYLEDVPEKSMMDSAWFDRGWTLQELIAPAVAEFYDRDWNLIRSKNHLLAELCSKTGIPEDILTGRASPSQCSIAQRMSWAARRETTRVEDRAYSLLGILEVAMPQIYGEREKAFLRLQRAIAQQSKDESIFAWSMGLEKDEKDYTGLFAPSPLSYLHCSDVVSTRGSTGFVETNGDLSITLKTSPHSMETFCAILNCRHIANPDSRITILLTRLSTENEYLRAKKNLAGGRNSIALSQLENHVNRPIRVPLQPTELPPNTFYGFWLRTLEPPGHTQWQPRILSRNGLTEADKVCVGESDWGTAGIVHFERKIKSDGDHRVYEREWSKICWIKVGFDGDFNPMLFLANYKKHNRWINSKKEDWGVIPNPGWFERAARPDPPPHARESIFDDGWISGEAGVPSRSDGWLSGVSILKIDRLKGVSGSLDALNLRISVKLRPFLSPKASVGEQMEEKIWVVDITDTRGRDPERYMSAAGKDTCCLRDPLPTESQRTAAVQFFKVLDASDLV